MIEDVDQLLGGVGHYSTERLDGILSIVVGLCRKVTDLFKDWGEWEWEWGAGNGAAGTGLVPARG